MKQTNKTMYDKIDSCHVLLFSIIGFVVLENISLRDFTAILITPLQMHLGKYCVLQLF